MDQQRIAQLVDRMGRVKSQIDSLQQLESRLRQELIDTGLPLIEGKRWKATVNTADTTYVDYPALVARLEPSPQLLRAFTQIRPRTTVRLTMQQREKTRG